MPPVQYQTSTVTRSTHLRYQSIISSLRYFYSTGINYCVRVELVEPVRAIPARICYHWFRLFAVPRTSSFAPPISLTAIPVRRLPWSRSRFPLPSRIHRISTCPFPLAHLCTLLFFLLSLVVRAFPNRNSLPTVTAYVDPTQKKKDSGYFACGFLFVLTAGNHLFHNTRGAAQSSSFANSVRFTPYGHVREVAEKLAAALPLSLLAAGRFRLSYSARPDAALLILISGIRESSGQLV